MEWVDYRDAQRRKPKEYCRDCGGELYGGDKLFDGMCLNCFQKYVIHLMEEAQENLADMLGIEVEEL